MDAATTTPAIQNRQWEPGDAPEMHPLWALQVELERGMLREGADHFRDSVTEAVNAKQMTRLDPVRGLLEDWLPKTVAGLKAWIRAHEGGKGALRGPKPIALEYIKSCDLNAACLIALREVLDGVTVHRAALTGLFVNVGLLVEHEQQVRRWEKEEPELFYAQQKKFKSAKSTGVHQRRVNINRFNALMAAGKFGFGWEPWSTEVHFRVGAELVDNIVRITRWFTYTPDPEHVFKAGHKHKPALVLTPRPELVEWIGKQLDSREVSSPAFMPCVMPPKRWTGTRNGGYYTPYIKTPRLVRFKAQNRDITDRAADEYDALHMPKVYDAIHFVQETAWKVNRRVLEVARKVIAKDMAIAGLPRMQASELPPRPADFEKNPEAALKWRRDAAIVYGENARLLSKSRSASRTLRIALQYDQYDRFYFPHMMDFRGRMYPIPVGLNPQGDDLARGLLTFAEGKPVTHENGGAGWLAIQVATMWGGGADKLGFEDRIAWVEESEELWRKVASDPLKHRDWADASKVDKPWQALAAIIEWVDFLDTGMGFVSHIPVVVDGTCNGIQHLSAMTRDEVAAEHVNLLPSDKPKDIYKFVANSLQEVLERIAAAGGYQADLASYWLELCDHDIPRTLTKRPVMVLPYGGTKDAYFTYTRKWLDEKVPLHKDATQEERTLRIKRLSFIVGHLWDVVGAKVSGGMVVMKWLRDCAKVVAGNNQPIVWQPATGFVVRHFYGKMKSAQMETKLDGRTVKLRLETPTKELDPRAQLLGISPNFVHSQDAAALTASINRAQEAGNIIAFSSVHDAYGTHAADMWELSGHLREAFIELHSEDALAGFRNSCLSMLVDQMVAKGRDPFDAAQIADEQLPALPPKGRLNLEDVRHSEYFFA